MLNDEQRDLAQRIAGLEFDAVIPEETFIYDGPDPSLQQAFTGPVEALRALAKKSYIRGFDTLIGFIGANFESGEQLQAALEDELMSAQQEVFANEFMENVSFNGITARMKIFQGMFFAGITFANSYTASLIDLGEIEGPTRPE